MIVFKDLRELSLRRQLDPPKALKTASHAYLQRFIERRGFNLAKLTSKRTGRRGSQYHRHDFPVPGMPVSQVALARRLMSQTATSVADLAAVLTRMVTPTAGTRESIEEKPETKALDAPAEDADQTAAEQEEAEDLATHDPEGKEERNEMAIMSLSDRALKRLKAIRKQELEKKEEIDARKSYLQQKPGQVKLDNHILERLSTEYDGSIGSPGLYPTTLDMIDAKNNADEATLAFTKALQQINVEKDSKRREIENLEAARIDQELAAKPAEERQQIESAIQSEKEQITNMISTEINKTRDMLRQFKDQARSHHKLVSNNKHPMSLEDRALIRDMNQYLLEKKAYLTQTYGKWFGPYTQINARVAEALAVIDEAHQERIAELEQNVREEYKDRAKKNSNGEDILVRWADRRDGVFAESWPENVAHGELENKAVVLSKALIVRQHAYLDENEDAIDEQKMVASLPRSNTVHVFGAEAGIDNRYAPEKLQATLKDARERRVREHLQTSYIQTRDKIIALQILQDDLSADLEDINIDLRNAIKVQINAVAGDLEKALDNAENEARRQEYTSYYENVAIGELQTELAKVTPEGDILESPISVADTDISVRAKELAVKIADAQIELGLLRHRNRFVVTDYVEPYERFAALFRERATMSLLYPAAEEWLAQEYSVLSETGTGPEGVAEIQEFESQHKFIADAMKRQRLNANSPIDLLPVDTHAQKLNAINNEIMNLNTRIQAPKSSRSKSNDVENLITRLRELKEDRIKHIQTNNAAFDKQAWREYREMNEEKVRNMLKPEEDLQKSGQQAEEEEQPKPVGFLGRLKNMILRR